MIDENCDLIRNPTIQQLFEALNDNWELWNVDSNGNHYKSSSGLLNLSNDLSKVYVKRKNKFVLEYGAYKFEKEELPQTLLRRGQAYFMTDNSGKTVNSYFDSHRTDFDRLQNKSVFLTIAAASKWNEMLLSFQNELLSGVVCE